MISAPYPLVAIIVLNWNGAADTIECLRSLDHLDYPNYLVVVVDNGSQDHSIERIEEYARRGAPQAPGIQLVDNSSKAFVKYLQSDVEAGDGRESRIVGAPSSQRLVLICNARNLGFAEGNNVALRYLARTFRPAYVFLLNNDTIVNPNFLSKLVHTAESRPEIGVIGPQIRAYGQTSAGESVSFCGGRIEWMVYPGYIHNRHCHEESTTVRLGLECDWVTGTAMMIRSECLRNGFLDSGYFFGCEDVDFCIRLRKLGYRSAVLPDSIIYHKGGKSRRRRYPEEVKDILASARTNLRFIRKNAPLKFVVIPIQTLQLAAIFVKAGIWRIIRPSSNELSQDSQVE